MMKSIQFSAIVLMTLLTLKLLMLPSRVSVNSVVNRSRWLMAAGTALLAIQFLLQYTFGFRSIGMTQAVMVNLALFIPCSGMMSVAVLYLQRRGRINMADRLVAPLVWLFVLALLGYAAAIDGQPLLVSSPEIYKAEVVSTVLYTSMQGYYSWKHVRNLKAMQTALRNYYDRDMDGMLRWMRMSIIILGVLAVLVPILIFENTLLLAPFGLFFFGGMFYLVDSFCSYVVSYAPARMMEAEQNEEMTASRDDNDNSSAELENMQRIDNAVQQWLKKGRYLRSGMKLPNAANGIGIPQYQLTAWLRYNNMRYSEWISKLRIDEAKRMLKLHPEWSNEAIAQHCGFNDRSYFQKKFKEVTGMSPADYQASLQTGE